MSGLPLAEALFGPEPSYAGPVDWLFVRHASWSCDVPGCECRRLGLPSHPDFTVELIFSVKAGF
jgi:hypothetical protein